MDDPAVACRADVWLWRARFAKTRSAAAALIEAGGVRLTHRGRQTRLDKASRPVHLGDTLILVRAGVVIEVRVADLGLRRGPPAEARTLYVETGATPPGPPDG